MAVASSIIAASIIAGASTAGAVYSAKKQGEANSSAQDAQTQATNQSIDFQKSELEYQKQQQEMDRQIAAAKVAYDQAQQKKVEANQARLAGQLSPYSSLGGGAVGKLSGMAGLPAPAAQVPGNGAMPGGATTTPPPIAAPGTTPPPRIQPTGTLAALSGVNPVQTQTQSSYVKMVAPDGSMQQVPQENVAKAQSLGAKVVS